MKRKPKFRVGQVVCIKRNWMHAGYYGRIEGMYRGKEYVHYGLSPEGLRVAEICIRHLTAREQGERK